MMVSVDSQRVSYFLAAPFFLLDCTYEEVADGKREIGVRVMMVEAR